MKTLTDKPSFQGDLLLLKVDEIPANFVAAAPENGVHVLAHSETGHHHVIESRNADMLVDKTNEFIAYLSVKEDSTIKHLRDFDTHDPLKVPAGKYRIGRQRQHVPEGYRRVED